MLLGKIPVGNVNFVLSHSLSFLVLLNMCILSLCGNIGLCSGRSMCTIIHFN